MSPLCRESLSRFMIINSNTAYTFPYFNIAPFPYDKPCIYKIHLQTQQHEAMEEYKYPPYCRPNRTYRFCYNEKTQEIFIWTGSKWPQMDPLRLLKVNLHTKKWTFVAFISCDPTIIEKIFIKNHKLMMVYNDLIYAHHKPEESMNVIECFTFDAKWKKQPIANYKDDGYTIPKSYNWYNRHIVVPFPSPTPGFLLIDSHEFHLYQCTNSNTIQPLHIRDELQKQQCFEPKFTTNPQSPHISSAIMTTDMILLTVEYKSRGCTDGKFITITPLKKAIMNQTEYVIQQAAIKLPDGYWYDTSIELDMNKQNSILCVFGYIRQCMEDISVRLNIPIPIQNIVSQFYTNEKLYIFSKWSKMMHLTWIYLHEILQPEKVRTTPLEFKMATPL